MLFFFFFFLQHIAGDETWVLLVKGSCSADLCLLHLSVQLHSRLGQFRNTSCILLKFSLLFKFIIPFSLSLSLSILHLSSLVIVLSYPSFSLSVLLPILSHLLSPSSFSLFFLTHLSPFFFLSLSPFVLLTPPLPLLPHLHLPHHQFAIWPWDVSTCLCFLYT